MSRISLVTIALFIFACNETPRTSTGGGSMSNPDAQGSTSMDAAEIADSSPMGDTGTSDPIDSGNMMPADSGTQVFPDAMMPVIDSGVPEDSGIHPDAMAPAAFAFYTPAWMDGGTVPTEFTCDGPAGWSGQNNPELIWENPPAGTAAFVMIFDDPAGSPASWGPNTSGWRHWAFFTSDATVLSIPQATSNTMNLPSGVTELRSGDQRVGYVPNCPPAPPSSYRWRIWAVNTANLGVSASSSFAQLEQAAENAKIESIQFVGVAY
jgi:hypothetical protein